MNIYISGISGTGMGPLALMAKDAGFSVFGSDLQAGPVASELESHNIEFEIGFQDGVFMRGCHDKSPIEWFVYTSALPSDHPELLLAERLGIKTSKRDEFLNFLIQKLDLRLIAVSGTHGKTTTTALLIWLFTQLQIPISFLIGSTLPFANAGSYNPESKYFIYEADEYDRNFLSFSPYIAVIPAMSYDHPDTYPTKADYQAAFDQFENQSQYVIKGNHPQISSLSSRLTLAGPARRLDASLAILATQQTLNTDTQIEDLIQIANQFPGVGRRFEKISDGVYSDYAHHPEEISTTIQMAIEEAQNTGKKGVIAIYEPHQNTRQVEIFEQYKNSFEGVTKLYWLPTFLTRENPDYQVISPEDFIATLSNKDVAESAETNDILAATLKKWQAEGYLILLMTAGPADVWYRKVFAN